MVKKRKIGYDEIDGVVLDVQEEVITDSDIQAAKKLEGEPKEFDDEVYEKLARFGIAANFGDNLFARGHKFNQFVK